MKAARRGRGRLAEVHEARDWPGLPQGVLKVNRCFLAP
jgi:hypothetical protein